MARYIDVDLLLDKIGTVPLWTGYNPPYSFEVHLALVEIEKQLKGIIKAIPTADVVEVERCKDCEHLAFDIDDNPYCQLWTDKVGEYPDYFCDTTYDNFCGYGVPKRKTG